MKQYHDIPKLSFMNETFITQVNQNMKSAIQQIILPRKNTKMHMQERLVIRAEEVESYSNYKYSKLFRTLITTET